MFLAGGSLTFSAKFGSADAAFLQLLNVAENDSCLESPLVRSGHNVHWLSKSKN